MTRVYHSLECGCLVSCDGGGGLIPCNFLEDEQNPDCKADEWIKHHKPCPICGECLVCYDHQECIRIWNRDHTYRTESVFTRKLRDIGLTIEQIVQVLSAIDSTCNYCWDSEHPCYCMRDD